MNRAQVLALSWDLTECLAAKLPSSAHARLCAKIGAGDPDQAIKELLAHAVVNKAVVPQSLALRVDAWMYGYTGSDNEITLRALMGRLKVEQRS